MGSVQYVVPGWQKWGGSVIGGRYGVLRVPVVLNAEGPVEALMVGFWKGWWSGGGIADRILEGVPGPAEVSSMRVFAGVAGRRESSG